MMEKSKEFNFWNDHSRVFLAAAYDYERHGVMGDADCVADQTGDCGDSVKIYLKLDGEKEEIARMQFEVRGCRNTNACCNALAELAEGRSVEEAWKITPDAVAELLETLPATHFHCAELTVGCFYHALGDEEK
ncbi:iron-sulfur cluster assembly scaffold protein [Desulforhopalus vacuolatus]|uniref:iron-sulfur cluster assembly scaffold protein n=1 Tax=Desulforhopalus vacuolatus TaxID=40414 RepID=UPI00196676F8|nr:iron-sulfur cluster assembly scaffold protein [Desulforhopalus vacuolatus]MBM9520294.1 iron-sulfur cluster assembly scaffold protein [Desulforhopalus vacuolatus]